MDFIKTIFLIIAISSSLSATKTSQRNNLQHLLLESIPVLHGMPPTRQRNVRHTDRRFDLSVGGVGDVDPSSTSLGRPSGTGSGSEAGAGVGAGAGTGAGAGAGAEIDDRAHHFDRLSSAYQSNQAFHREVNQFIPRLQRLLMDALLALKANRDLTRKRSWPKSNVHTRFAPFGTKLVPNRNSLGNGGSTLFRYGRSV